MSGTGKFCLVVTLLLLLLAMLPIPSPYGGWTPQVLLIHNKWSEKLRDAKADLQTKQREHAEARQELMKAAADIDATAIGWDRVWHVAGGQNAPQAPRVQVLPNGNLRLVNLGQQHGLTNGQAKDESGNDVVLQLIIHAFYGGGEAMTYAGEFKAININQTGAEFSPVHAPEQEDIANWSGNHGWRLRSIIPGGTRAQIDDLQKSKIRVRDLIALAEKNMTRQQALLTEAQAALAVRRGELLGDPNRDNVRFRPEFTEGLLKVTEEVEEKRDQLSLDVDTLRRNIKTEGEGRDARIGTLNEAIQALPGSSTEYDEIRTPQVASGK